MKFSSVLIITYGRSGSTLLQGLLNSIDGCVVRGENYNLCMGLYNSYVSLREASTGPGRKGRAGSPTFPFYGANLLDEQRFLEDARGLVLNQLLPPDARERGVKCIGFKEIRYLPEHVARRNGATSLPDYLDFLAKLFSNPAFVVLTRDHEQVVKSGWWKKREAMSVKKQLAAFASIASQYAETRPWVFSITYADMVGRTAKLQELFEFLGAPYDAEKIEAVLSVKHSTNIGSRTSQSTRKFDLSVETSELVEHIAIDKLPLRARRDGRISLGGVVVLSRAAEGQYELMAVDANGNQPVTWGLPSPRLRKQFPDHPTARSSRFHSDGLRISPETPVSLFLVTGSGARRLLATLSLTPESQPESRKWADVGGRILRAVTATG